MTLPFSEHLKNLRRRANLTDRQLAELADVPRSFISAVQSGARPIGELQARKVGVALGLSGLELDSFVLSAIDSCQHKVLTKYNDFPAEVLNHLARQLSASGITANQIQSCQRDRDSVTLTLEDGRKAIIQAQVECQ